MTAPVGRDDVVAATAKHLRNTPVVRRVVGAYGDPPSALIVQDAAPERADFTGATAAVIALAPATGGGQIDSDGEHTWRVMLELWADPIRDASGMAPEPAETRRRLVNAYMVIDQQLHRPRAFTAQWGDLRITGCRRLVELTAYLVPGSGGLWRGTAFYAVSTG